MKKSIKSLTKIRANIRAFTLIELMIVIAIIGILTAIVMTSLTGAKSKSRDAKRISDIGNLQLALELYYDRCKVYPNGMDLNVNIGYNNTTCSVKFGDFISVMPTDPTTKAIYDYAKMGENSTGGSVVDYVIHARLENYNEVMKDSLSPVPDAPSGYRWYSISTNSTTFPSDFTCTNAVNTKEYCRGPR